MESLKRSAVAKILMALYRRGRLYSVEIQRETELSLRHLNNVLPEMVKDDFVVFDIEKNKNTTD